MADDVKNEESLSEFWWRVAREFKENGRFRFSVVEGRRYYEPSFVLVHQSAVDGICLSIKCLTESSRVWTNTHVAFGEWTLLCPDIAIWSEMPDETVWPVQHCPEAVVEVLSCFALDRDLKLGLACYLQAGVADILIVDPEVGQTYHFKPGEPERNYTSPHTLILECGCQITV